MRWIAVLTLAMVLAPVASHAQSSCATLTNQDQRWYCRARAEGKSSYCASIVDPSLRRLCGAETGRPSECASIIDPQKRRYCEGVTGR
jgi:hypothetical protein